MKHVLPYLIILIVSMLAIVMADQLTASPVAQKNPCRMIRCNVQLFGFIQSPPEWIGTTPDGMAVCHCPQESYDYLFYVDIKPRR